MLSSPSLGCASQKRLEKEIASAGNQGQYIPASVVSTDEDKGMVIPDHDPQILASTDPSPDYVGQERGKEGAIGACDQLQCMSASPGATDRNEETGVSAVQHTRNAPAISSPYPGCAGKEATIPRVGERLHHPPSGSTEKNEENIITMIRATDVALGQGRPPAWFYIVLHHNGIEWRTVNKFPSTNKNVVEWSTSIPISSDLSAIVCIEVYESLEYQPTLGAREWLRRLVVTVGQLLDHSVEGTPFTFIPKDGDVGSPCSSILVTLKQQKRETCDSSGSRVVGPQLSTIESRGELEDATDQGYNALTCYRKHGEKRDPEHSVQRLERALSIRSQDGPHRADAKSNLARASSILSQADDVDVAPEFPFQSHQDTLTAHPDHPFVSNQTTPVHLARPQREKHSVYGGNSEDANGLFHEETELSTTDSYKEQAATLMLRLCAGHRGGRVGSDGQSSVEQDLTLSSSDEGPWRLSVSEQFEQLGDLAEQQAITVLEGQVKTTPIWDRNYLVALRNLGAALLRRYECHGELGDLNRAISTQRDVVAFTRNDPDRCIYRSILGVSFQIRFNRLGQLGDLEDAISNQREVVRLTPASNPYKPIYLNNLGISLRIRFERLAQVNDLEDAISTQQEAVRLTPESVPYRPIFLNNLGTFYRIRFERLGDPVSLKDAISTFGEAVRLTPDNDRNKPRYLNDLGNSFRIRFECLGELGDLEDALSTLREAVRLTPDDDSDKPVYLITLCTSLQRRFERLREPSDLGNAILVGTEAVRLIPHDHPKKPMCLSNLGTSFATRFERFGELKDLEDAISNQREAVGLTPDSHRDRPLYLNNLGTSFRIRFEHLKELSDLEDAISNQREAVGLTPDGHRDKPVYLNNLGTSLQRRFLELQAPGDLDDAISRRKHAVHLTSHDHPDKAVYLNNLATSFITRFHFLRQDTDLNHAISLSSYVASIPIGPPSVRLSAAELWIQCALDIRHPSLLHAYSVAVKLIPQLAWIGLSLSHRYDELIRGVGLVQEAAAAALDAGFPQTALEWLEQGRSIVWEELFQLRSSYEELSSAHPDYANRLCALSIELDHASAAHEQFLSSPSEQNQGGAHDAAESLQQVADRHRALAIERDKLLQEIRRLPGFEKFLLRKPFSQLRAAAHSGPVVILNAAKSRCDALIVVTGLDHVIHVPLPNFSSERCIDLQVTLRDFVRDTRAAKIAPGKGVSWDEILSPLWQCMVKPVLDALAFSVVPKELSRIFWCPTGPLTFLPIHAAGLYNRGYSTPGHKVFDFVVSSYVPTLALLARSPSPAAVPSRSLRLLAVRQPLSDGHAPLPGVATELAYIKDIVENSPSAQTILMESSASAVEEVLQLMTESDWVHFACHGAQDGVNSGLCLANRRRLTLRDIVAVSRPRGGLAFLSACQTARGDRKLSDEAIHIAAGMLFAGYGGVIGTMWSISDGLAPRVARDVYQELLGKGRRPDYREAARALHDTIGRLRDQDVPISEWIPFIHVGL